MPPLPLVRHDRLTPGRGNCSAGSHRRVLSCGEPPRAIAANEHVHGHFGERLGRVGTGWPSQAIVVEGEPSDVGHDHLRTEGEHVAHLVAEGRLARGCFLEAHVNRVQLFEAVDECPERAAPGDVCRELPVEDVGITLVVAGLEAGGEGVDDTPGLRVGCSDGRVAGCGRGGRSCFSAVHRPSWSEVLDTAREALFPEVPAPRDGGCDLEYLP